jgi:hypothetical protein
VSSATLGRPGNQEMVTLGRGPRGLVAVGWDDSRGDEDAAVWTSTDGAHWKRVPHRPSLGGPGTQEMIGITWSPAGFVAVGEDGPAGAMDGAAWVSPDGRSWKEQTGPELGGPGIQLMRTVVVFHGKVLALGREHAPGGDDAVCWVGTIHRL